MDQSVQDISRLSGRTQRTTSAEAIVLARQALSELLDTLAGETLMLLSGGSVIEIYDVVAAAIKHGRGQQWRFGLIDERFGDEGHAHSNAVAIEQKTGLISLCQSKQIPFQTILRQLPMSPTVSIYQHWLEEQLETCPQRIALLGLGVDGHTAGILPSSKQRFDSEFATDQLVVGYSSGTEFDQRITVTPAFLQQMTHTILLAYGPGKAEAFDKASTVDATLLMHEVPGSIVQQLRDVQAFIGTD
jgi:6-phosphogluconolactonase/glucosamine-6-phosphate isomerase/deaminase